MEKTWRWFGKKDKIKLDMLRQIGVEGIVSALHDIPNGEVWSLEAINDYKNYIESFGLRWSVVESLAVSESIKYGGEDRDRLIENYILSLENLGKAGVTTVCYNFMPVLDWARTDLFHQWEDGSSSLYFDKAKFAYFEIHILQRKGAENDYNSDILQKVEQLKNTLTDEDNNDLIDSIIVKTQGFVNGNIKEGDKNPIQLFKNLLALYDGIDKEQLRQNMKYFLEKIMPVCEKWNIQMCVHPDDPPFSLLGLPRIVTNEEDIDWLLNSVNNPHNGLTFCTGSLSAGLQNDVPKLAQKYAHRTKFVHLRSTNVFDNGDFIEAHHLGGRGKLIEVIKIFEKENPDLPMRVDHGRLLTDDIDKGYNPGYSFLGRMLALGQIEGVMAAVNSYSK
ncbi:mannonate dehydratase [Chryseobacterium sp. 3008163]|uniref:mannonate dehydratase n=1 Tax=Chryseobacterium sp. 3008163 TaxID=2478663 RepID=UPI000F0C40BC|nr:mannonate dehydratase [Chryseobacterium sp. 3008163]AYM99045.1 mannonate dehydratase [Chryseobacterium sp. 3008163]